MKKKITWLTLIGVAIRAASVPLTSCDGDDDDDPNPKTETTTPDDETPEQDGMEGGGSSSEEGEKGTEGTETTAPEETEEEDEPYPASLGVDLGLSVLWAPYNVGANAPGDAGSYFAWGEKRAKSYFSLYNTNTTVMHTL